MKSNKKKQQFVKLDIIKHEYDLPTNMCLFFFLNVFIPICAKN